MALLPVGVGLLFTAVLLLGYALLATGGANKSGCIGAILGGLLGGKK